MRVRVLPCQHFVEGRGTGVRSPDGLTVRAPIHGGLVRGIESTRVPPIHGSRAGARGGLQNHPCEVRVFGGPPHALVAQSAEAAVSNTA
jgi:hypothetical protein